MAKQATVERSRFHLPKTLPKKTRALVESAIERHQAATEALLAFMDAADGDPDLEPSLGSRGCTYDADYFDQTNWAQGAANDAEGDEHDGREPDEADNEPDLGWPERINQERALKSCSEDGCSIGGEPSLGSCESIDQRGWSQGDRRDLEVDYLDAMTGRARSVDDEPECEDEGAEHDGREDRSAPFELVQDGAP